MEGLLPEQLVNKFNYLKQKYPDKVPVVVHIYKKSNIILPKNRFLVPPSITIAQFITVLRKQISLSPEQSIFLFFNNTLQPISKLISEIYKEHKDKYGFLHITMSNESTFGYRF